MSGAKVVRPVTREEKIKRAERELGFLRKKIDSWKAFIQKTGDKDEIYLQRLQDSYKSAQACLKTYNFAQFSAHASALAADIDNDISLRQEKYLQKQINAKRARNRLKENAKYLLEISERKKDAFPRDLCRALRNISKLDKEEARSALSKAFALVSAQNGDIAAGAVSEKQRNLARQLREDAKESAEKWIYAGTFAHTEALSQAQSRVEELKLFADESVACLYEKKIAEIENLEDANRQRLLFDSLILDIIEAGKTFKKKKEMLEKIESNIAFLEKEKRTASAELSGLSDEIRKIRQSLSACPLHILENFLKKSNEAAELAASADAAERGRRFILESLQAMGYKVNESMTALWRRREKLVIEKNGGYGVEVGEKGGRIQLRTVSFNISENAQKDKEAEMSFCEEMNKIARLCADRGGELVIERSIPAGTRPVKLIKLRSQTDCKNERSL